MLLALLSVGEVLVEIDLDPELPDSAAVKSVDVLEQGDARLTGDRRPGGEAVAEYLRRGAWRAVILLGGLDVDVLGLAEHVREAAAHDGEADRHPVLLHRVDGVYPRTLEHRGPYGVHAVEECLPNFWIEFQVNMKRTVFWIPI